MFPQSAVFVALQTTAATNGETATSQAIDCKGYDFLSLDLVSTTSNNVTNKPATLKLQEADTTDATNFGDITGFRGGTDFTIPNWGTNTSTILPMKFNVDLRHRKRYLKLVVSPVTTQSFTAVANLHRGAISPVSAADVGAGVVVSG